MLPGTTNILDQLLGGFEVKPAGGPGATGVSAEGEPQGLLFGDLLSQTMAGSQIVGEPGEQLLTQSMFPSIDQPAAQDEAPAGPTVERGSLIETMSGLDSELEEQIQIVPKNQERALPLTVNSKADGAILNPHQVKQVDLASLLPANTEIESGSYRVLDSRLVDGRLDLTLVAEGRTQEPINISLPAGLLSDATSRLSVGNAKAWGNRTPRVPIDGFTRPQPGPMDELLSRLNLKGLEIKADPEPVSVKSRPSTVEVTLVVENAGVRWALKNKLAQQDIQIKTSPQSRENHSAGGDQSKVTIVKGDEPLFGKADRPGSFGELPRRMGGLAKFDLPDRLGGSKRPGIYHEIQNNTVTLDKNFDSVTTAVERKMVPTVKMTLPETIHKPFSAGGQTIMIRIEPDHLGPARLNLALRDQILTARVMVDTPMARMAVQNSLEQLTDQLSRAGIEVDRIEVELSGNGAREQFLDRRSAWSHARKTRRFEKDLESGADAVGTIPVVTAPPRQYLEAGRVNLLA